MHPVLDIIIVVDTGVLVAAGLGLDPDHPAECPEASCYMIAPGWAVADGQGSAKLRLKSSPAALRWSMLARPASRQRALLYRIVQTATLVTAATGTRHHWQRPVPVLVEDAAAEPGFAAAPAHRYFMATALTGPCIEEIEINFCLTDLDRSSGQPALAGYCRWRPILEAA